MVAPRGRTKLVTDFGAPTFSQLSMVTGSVALELAVEKDRTRGSSMFRAKARGERRPTRSRIRGRVAAPWMNRPESTVRPPSGI